jgi:hydroxyacyl-ACP dehydratase HTD2-like protein with hotdog domain
LVKVSDAVCSNVRGDVPGPGLPPSRRGRIGDRQERLDLGAYDLRAPTLLFRFSALTYNAHRIHYDREYAVVTEGYPGLVVHGPLQAMLLADAVRRWQSDFGPTRFSFHGLASAFDDHDLELRARLRGRDLELAAFSGGRKTMTAVATR